MAHLIHKNCSTEVNIGVSGFIEDCLYPIN